MFLCAKKKGGRGKVNWHSHTHWCTCVPWNVEKKTKWRWTPGIKEMGDIFNPKWMHKIKKVNIFKSTWVHVTELNFMAGHLHILGDTEETSNNKSAHFISFSFFSFKILHSPRCNFFFKKKYIFTSNLLFYLIYFFPPNTPVACRVSDKY